ncbi:hypothetical protein EDD15DRAFT_1091112 [Pisolithus albus]|nr:hypothetical protein EDD15DRAFT_1091112 [Pisolithus albus]
MSPETTSKPSRPAKPTTRASLRQSLNFTSVGKALADVINKDPREREEKTLKKSKESSRRLSALMATGTTMSKATVANPNSKSPNSTCTKGDRSPTNKTITRSSRRQSGLFTGASSSDELGVKVANARAASPVSRRLSTLRPRTAAGNPTSALPKYRPKSAVVEKPASPAHAGTRRRLSTSEEDEAERVESPKSKGSLRMTEVKTKRPVSPLPHRALAVKVNLPSPTGPSTPQKSKSTPSKDRSNRSPAGGDSARPKKSLKTGSPSPSRLTLVRPGSSASSTSSSRSRNSPSTPSSFKNAFGFKCPQVITQIPSPLRSIGRSTPQSPFASHSRRDSCSLALENTPTGAVEGRNDDSIEVGEVDLLLAPVASLAAPTPAIPRIQYCQSDSQPHTPSRPPSLLPTRANLSYLSPIPPNSESSPALRPKGGSADHHRGSVFSWDQLADQSQLLAQDEVESMLADVTAPFTPGGVSPNVSAMGLEMPDSPSLSALPSPAGYGSISQVLLPDVTPSPSVHHLTQVFETSTELPVPSDSGTVALLRLQVAQVEKTARERLSLVHELEEQLHSLKQSRLKETEELAKQISFLEEQLHSSVQTRERIDEDRAAFTASLQAELRQAEARREQTAQEAFVRGQEEARAALDAMLHTLHKNWEASSAAREAGFLWSFVRDQAEEEKSNLQGSRDMLRVFLAMLDCSQGLMQDLPA